MADQDACCPYCGAMSEDELAQLIRKMADEGDLVPALAALSFNKWPPHLQRDLLRRIGRKQVTIFVHAETQS